MTLLTEQLPRRTAGASPRDSDAPAARLRVLVSAYAVSPVRGSEPGLGWNLVSRLARFHDVTVLCATGVPGPSGQDFRAEIARHLTEHGPVAGLTPEFVEAPPLSRWFQRETPLCRRTVYYAGYAAWQRAAYRVAAALHARRPFDLVHHLNITGYREPGYLWKLPAPFVWGPVGGAAYIPAPFFPLMGWQDQLFYRLRNLVNAGQKRLSRRPRAAARAARHVWAIGEENRRMVRDVWGREAENLIESGAAPRDGASVRGYTPDNGRPLRLVWSGQHIGRKALPILLHALAELGGTPPVELAVLGAGAETARWTALADRLGVAGRVRWAGQLSHALALAEVNRADAMVFTSVQEGTPHAVLEALSLGVPVVCHDACGMGVAVNDTCGIKVPMTDPAASTAGFAAALRRLASEHGLIARLSRGALDRAAELNWDAKAALIADRYRAVVATQTPHGKAGTRR